MNKQATAHLLVVDDEPDLLTLYEITLQRCGYQVQTASDLEQARELLAQQQFDVLVTDMRLPDGQGLELIEWLQTQQRPERGIVITAYGSADNAVRALKAGAFDYLTKPVNLDQFRSVVAQAIRAGQTLQAAAPAPSDKETPPAPIYIEQDKQPTKATPASPASKTKPVPISPNSSPPAMENMVGSGAGMQQLKATLTKVAPSMAPVLVLGESGSGKELVARALHQCSHRAAGPFVAVNCGAIPETLLEAEFFGAKKGAYTGATADREGLFQAATGGTLFLDEIGDLPLSMQAKLLRVIQERQVRPLGAANEIPVDVRIVSATHKNPAEMVQTGQFRQDLYYRLNVIEVRVPPLRERREDIPALAQALLQKIIGEGQTLPVMTPAFVARLQNLPLPGNVRELENTLHRCWALSDGQTLDADLLDGATAVPVPVQIEAAQTRLHVEPDVAAAFDTVMTPPVAAQTAATIPGTMESLPTAPPATDSLAIEQPLLAHEVALPCDLDAFVSAHEKALLLRALHQTQFNRTAAASLLGLNLRQIRYRMERLGIQAADNDTP